MRNKKVTIKLFLFLVLFTHCQYLFCQVPYPVAPLKIRACVLENTRLVTSFMDTSLYSGFIKLHTFRVLKGDGYLFYYYKIDTLLYESIEFIFELGCEELKSGSFSLENEELLGAKCLYYDPGAGESDKDVYDRYHISKGKISGELTKDGWMIKVQVFIGDSYIIEIEQLYVVAKKPPPRIRRIMEKVTSTCLELCIIEKQA